MIRAEQKKIENIAEYIVHLFKTEDLVRTFEFDLNKITNQVIFNLPVSDSEKKELILWYASIIEKMQSQKIVKAGHLLEINELINSLTSIHTKLIDKESDYKTLVTKADPYLQNQIQESKGRINNTIEVCLNAVYGFLLLKVNGKKVSPDQQNMLESFGDILSYLSYRYRKEIN